MRITNKIMQNNNLTNINNNKILQDKLSTQMSTGKKISKPSDDPVIAIRALRLRSNVTEVVQYYKKNIPDANSWLEVTEGALNNTAKVLTSIIGQYTSGARGYLTSGDRKIILEQLKALRDEIYSTADVDYAGRYVFSGYRTDTSVTFTDDTKKEYTITQQMDNSAIDSVTHVRTTVGNKDLYDIDSTNYEDIDILESDVDSVEVHRIRLSYDNTYYDPDDDTTIPTLEVVTGRDANGDITTAPIVAPDDVIVVHSYDVPSAYELAADPAFADKVFYIPETGEMVLGDDIYQKMMAYKDDPSTSDVNEGEIRITYKKSEWDKGDLRPEHYYACSSVERDDNGDVTKQLNYNQDYLNGKRDESQVIEYDVGFNQTIRVNTRADECFDPGIGREVDDMIRVLEDVQNLENIAGKLKDLMEGEEDEDKLAALQSRLKAVNKALTLNTEKMQRMFESGITAMQGYLDANSLAITNCGTRSSKLELIEYRMSEQKITFEELQSQNEDIDITDVVINLESASMIYNAALMATGKVMQTNLLNFI